MVVPPRMYAIGGTSNREFWGEPGVIASTLSDVHADATKIVATARRASYQA